YDHKRVAVDVGDVVNADVAVRISAMAEQSDSYRNGVELERKGINPTMTIRAGANTSVNLGYEHFRYDRIADRGIPSMNGRPYETDVSTFFGSAELS
ncbi:hypothetical protein, partial [Escherichia coli]|uniref:hypothetical protein n=1 Tax=Escherichia coli TaxID=562 RepID=UPI001F45681C